MGDDVKVRQAETRMPILTRNVLGYLDDQAGARQKKTNGEMKRQRAGERSAKETKGPPKMQISQDNDDDDVTVNDDAEKAHCRDHSTTLIGRAGQAGRKESTSRTSRPYSISLSRRCSPTLHPLRSEKCQAVFAQRYKGLNNIPGYVPGV
ncbi:hypothetical protein CIHG_01862 [Coccidioides immitis H538.4]|uniref:Uncharacterized protein n=2 Tax=Coccidioides immitis TaxID=5501 RepID=A0A0J8RGP0_COCIT|nr:hypothetical protein CIRG_06183 [Coccidioides immitis RMSCC 2394]KMU84077.1 hypothetical protein CIHG_01862 [Coccidioides immitis H538.4]